MTKETTEKTKIEWNDACMLLHTALRKVCESKPTSALYQVIHLICSLKDDLGELHAWHLFGKLVVEGIDAGQTPCAAVHFAQAHLTDRFYAIRKEMRLKDRAEHDNANVVLYALKCSLDCLSKEDISRMVSFLED